MSDDWSHEETDDPLYADQRNFYKVEKWSRDGQRVNEMLFAMLRRHISEQGSLWFLGGRARA